MHKSPFAYLKNAAEYQVKVLVVSSNNKHKNIELQFADESNDGNYTFVDLCFGEYFYELFDCQEVFFAKLFKSQKQYEIYDWNTYQCIIK